MESEQIFASSHHSASSSPISNSLLEPKSVAAILDSSDDDGSSFAHSPEYYEADDGRKCMLYEEWCPSGSSGWGTRMGDCCAGDAEFLKEFCIPNHIFNPDDQQDTAPHVPICPVVVFINPRSGGQLGGELLTTYRKLLNASQVFDIGEEPPDKVLLRIYGNLEHLKGNQDHLAIEIEKKLRLIVAGGDGTASWLLGVVSDLKLTYPPPIATVPLGTGNNIHFSFGWGKKNPGTDCHSVKAFLHQVKKAREMSIDSWRIIMRMKVPIKGPCDPIAPLELPHSLHGWDHISNADPLNMDGYKTYCGGFWNYFSMGMDAQVSYAFHLKRKLNPQRFKNQLINQCMYLKFACSQGWFCASLVQDSSRNVAQLTKVRVIKKAGEDWMDLHIPQRIRAIVCLNLPSFSGGLNPWGIPSKSKSHDKDLTVALIDDGLLEIVGFKNSWHGLLLLSSKGHGTRLAQANRVRFEFRKNATEETYMRLDGEPWKQPLPKDDGSVVVEISCLGQVRMLATGDCRCRSIVDESSTMLTPSHPYDLNSKKGPKEGKKFGVANTFRLPHDIDISRLN